MEFRPQHMLQLIADLRSDGVEVDLLVHLSPVWGSPQEAAALGGGYRGPRRLASPKIDTSGHGELLIGFRRYLSDEMDDPASDYLKLEAKADNGWRTIREWGPGAGADGRWHEEEVVLTAAEGGFFWSGFRVRFSYRGGGSDGDYVGIDDVTIGAR